MGKFPKQTPFFSLLRGNHPRPNPQFSCCFNLQQSEAEPNVNYDLFPKKIAVLPDLVLWICHIFFITVALKKLDQSYAIYFTRRFFRWFMGYGGYGHHPNMGFLAGWPSPCGKALHFHHIPSKKNANVLLSHRTHIYIYEYYYCYCINKYSNINVIVLIIPISLSSGTTFRSFQFLHCDLRRTSQSPRPRVVALVGPGRGSLPGFVVKPAVSSGFVSSKMGPKWEFPRCFEEVSKQFVKQKLKLELSKEYRRSFNPNHPSHRWSF